MSDYLDQGYDNFLNYTAETGIDLPALSSGSSSSSDGSTIGSESTSTLPNPTTDSVSPNTIEDGDLISAITIARDAYIKGGATNYNVGTGFWLGYYSSTKTYNFFIGAAAGNKLTWDGTTLSIIGTLSVGSIAGGWIITATALYSLASGTPTSSPNNGVVLTSSANPTLTVYEGTAKRMEYGYLSAAVYGIKGYDTTGSTTIFEISDTQQMLAGWNFTEQYLYKLSSGTPTSSPNNGVVIGSGSTPSVIVYEGTAVRVQLGYLSAAVFGLLGYDTTGAVKLFELSDTQQMIAGWKFTSTVLRTGASDAASNVLIDSSNSLIRLGPTSGNYLTLDGTNLRVRTSTFSAGSQGWSIETDGSAEFANITARGEFHSQVLSYGEIHATAGTSILAKSAGKLKNDVTTATSPTTFNVDIDDPDTGHVQVFAVSDILHIKDGSGGDNWLTVSSVSDQTTYYRYVCTKNNGSNGTFRAGAAVVDYGASGQGIIVSTVDGSNAPYVSIQTHAGSPWSTVTEKTRLGKLDGITDTLFGALTGYGLWTNNVYLTGSVFATAGQFGTTSNYWQISSGVLVATGSGDVAIRAGQTDYNTGTGFWLGLKTGVAKFSLGLSSGDNLTWNGTNLSATGTIYALSGQFGTTTNYWLISSGVLVATGSGDVAIRAGQTDYNTGTGLWLGLKSSTAKFSLGDGGISQYMTWDGSTLTVNGSNLANQDIFGDGHDGTVTISTNTTLARDMFYNDLTVSQYETGTLTAVTTSSDGDMVFNRTTAESFATKRAALTDNSRSESATTIQVNISSNGSSNTFDNLSRCYLEFDTSSLADDATIISATLQLYVSAKDDAFSPAQSISIVHPVGDFGSADTADYNIANWDTTKQATDVAISAISLTAYNTWTLNSTGRANISLTGMTLLGVWMSCDADNSGPTWAANTDSGITFHSAENASTFAPKLTVNWQKTITLDAAGFRIHVKGTLTVNGIISRKGNFGSAGGNGGDASSGNTGVPGTAGAAGAALADGSLKGSVAGVAGTAGSNGSGGANGHTTNGTDGVVGTVGNSVAKSGSAIQGSAGGASGDNGTTSGGSSTIQKVGAAGGAAGATTGTVFNPPYTLFGAWLLQDFFPSLDAIKSSAGSGSGAGGAGGGSHSTGGSAGNEARTGGSGGGGGSGSPGGILGIYAHFVVISSTGLITAAGGAGGKGGNAGVGYIHTQTSNDEQAGGSGGGGGGAGGAGGLLIMVYSRLTNSGTISVAGGTAGIGGTKGTGLTGGSGTANNGTDGVAGTDGLTGLSISLQK